MIFRLKYGFELKAPRGEDFRIKMPIRALPKPRMTRKSARYSKVAKKYFAYKDTVSLFCIQQGLTLPLEGAWFILTDCYFPTKVYGDADNYTKAFQDILFKQDKLVEGMTNRIYEKGREEILLRLWGINA